MKKFKNLKLSVTLVELLVSLGIFAVLMTLVIGIYLQSIGPRVKIFSQTNIQKEAEDLMQILSKEIRKGKIDYDFYSSGITFPEETLALIDLETNQNIVYSLETVGERRAVKKKIDSQEEIITPSSIDVLTFNFYISPTSTPFRPGAEIYQIPKVSILLKLKDLEKKAGEPEITLQQTIPQRYGPRM